VGAGFPRPIASITDTGAGKTRTYVRLHGRPDVGTHLQNQLFAAECEGKQKRQKGQKWQNFRLFAVFVLFAFFASTSQRAANPDIENVSRRQVGELRSNSRSATQNRRT
jgi:hypothetical protein